MTDHESGPQYPKYPGEGESVDPARSPAVASGSAPEQPQSIQTAVKLMLAGAALSLLGTIVSLATLGSLKDTVADSLRESDPNVTQSTIDAAYSVAIAAGVVGGVIGILLWLWMAWKNGQGRSWARVLATVFGGLNLISVLFSMVSPQANALGTVFSLISLVLAVVILVLLWRKESSAYYDAVSQSRMI